MDFNWPDAGVHHLVHDFAELSGPHEPSFLCTDLPGGVVTLKEQNAPRMALEELLPRDNSTPNGWLQQQNNQAWLLGIGAMEALSGAESA